ncbi:MAG: hypothetical protein QNJ84_17120 [Alphaproteobacteria bacterium]|nr:hypothetical protein [Alphaproteobacteria bacterium]
MAEFAYNFALLEDESLKEAVQAFEAFRSEDGLYSYKLFDVTKLPPSAFPNLLLVHVDRESGETRLLIKIIGQMWLDFLAVNPTGKYMDEFPGVAHINRRLLEATADKRAYAVRDTFDTGRAFQKRYESAVFPLLDPDDTVVAIVSVSVIDYAYLELGP